MERSPLSSPLRKKQRLSSPTYDLFFDELDNTELEALDEIELSQKTNISPSSQTFLNELGKRIEPEVDNLGHDDSGIEIFGDDCRGAFTTLAKSISDDMPTKPPTLTPTTSFAGHAKEPTPSAAAAFLPVSMMISAADLRPEIQRSPSPEEPPQPNHDDWFSSTGVALPAAFGSASALLGLPATALKDDSTPIKAGPAPNLLQRPTLSWALPSTDALKKAKQKFKAWEAEIEGELKEVASLQEVIEVREPLKVVGNSLDLPKQSLVKHDKSTVLPVHQPFNSPAVSTAHIKTPSRSVASPCDVSTSQNPLLAQSRVAVDFPFSGRSVSQAASSTPVKPSTSISQIHFRTPTSGMLSQRPNVSQVQRNPQNVIPLGLTPRSRALTGSSARPKFVTPFKKALKSGNESEASPFKMPQVQSVDRNISQGIAISPRPAVNLQQSTNEVEALPKPLVRLTLANSGLLPQTYDNDELEIMGIDTSLFDLMTVSHFLYYRFNPVNIANPSTQMSLGPDSALERLHKQWCRLATKKWVENHWCLILWKMIGMTCLDPEKMAKRWSWDEVMRQLQTRYQRELAGSSRPALRLITTQDASPSGPLVLCISDIFWTDEHIDETGQLVPAHPELEVTDGWYRLRAKVDEPLARAVRNKVLRTGRKIACNGAKLDSLRKDPVEVLEAYDSVRLVLTGNSTHLSPWHTRLGFQPTPFIATLRSLTPDGGIVPLLDLIITEVYPIGFIEYITLSTGEIVREGPRTEADEAIEQERWQAKRSSEVAKLQESLEKRLERLELFADRLDRIAGGGRNPSAGDDPPDNLINLIDELEDSEDPASVIATIPKEDAGWLALLLRKRCETDRDHASEEFDRELATLLPLRRVRNFRVLCVKDARTVRRPSHRTAQLTIWDVLSMQNADDGGSFRVGQRYLVSNLMPTQQNAWMGLEPGSEVYLSTRNDSKWKVLQ